MTMKKGKKSKHQKAVSRTGHPLDAKTTGPDITPTVEIVTGQPIPAEGKKSARAAPPTTEKPMRRSALNAAAEVLMATGVPMRVGQIVEAMASRGLWSSANGKTPEATLHSAISREIATKGQASRFRKTARGLFAAVNA
jgi:hypothetical protein